MKIVAVDPRRVGIAAQADVLLQVQAGHGWRVGVGADRCRRSTEKLYDDSFVRQWTNGTFLIRSDTGAALTEADIDRERIGGTICCLGRKRSNAPVIYDPSSRQF